MRRSPAIHKMVKASVMLSSTGGVTSRTTTTDVSLSDLPNCCDATVLPATTRKSPFEALCKVFRQRSQFEMSSGVKSFHSSISTYDQVISESESLTGKSTEPEANSGNEASVDGGSVSKPNRKKLKSKREVVRWLKFFRWKKKKEYERMTPEEKILYKLKKARNKEARLVEALKKLDPPDSSETTHDPEILTPEEHFYFLKMGRKSRNYVPIGRRGIYQGVILNMHLHWKKHQTLKVIVKTFSPEEVRGIAAELAKLSGGIVLDVYDDDTIVMYRGKNYVQPPTEIMSPKITLSRRKALHKSMYRDSLRALRTFIPRLERELEDLKKQAQTPAESSSSIVAGESSDITDKEMISKYCRSETLIALHENTKGNGNPSDDGLTVPNTESEYESLSDILETDSDQEADDKESKPLYLDEFEKLPSNNHNIKPVDFDEQMQQISAVWKNSWSSKTDKDKLELDEVDKLFLRAGSSLRKRRR